MERVRKYWKYIVGLIVVLGVTAVGIRYATASADLAVTISGGNITGSGTANSPYIVEIDKDSSAEIDYSYINGLDENGGGKVEAVYTVASDDRDVVKIAMVPGGTGATNATAPADTDYEMLRDYNASTGTDKIRITAEKSGIAKITIITSEYGVDANGAIDLTKKEQRAETVIYVKVPFVQGAIISSRGNDLLSATNHDTLQIEDLGSTVAKLDDVVFEAKHNIIEKSQADGKLFEAKYGGTTSIKGTYTNYNLTLETEEIPVYVKVEMKTEDGSFVSPRPSGTTYKYFEVLKDEGRLLSDMFNVLDDGTLADTVGWEYEKIPTEADNIFENSANGIIGKTYGVGKILCYPKGRNADAPADVYIIVPRSVLTSDILTINVGDTYQIVDDDDNLASVLVSGGLDQYVISTTGKSITALSSGTAKATVNMDQITTIYGDYYIKKRNLQQYSNPSQVGSNGGYVDAGTTNGYQIIIPFNVKVIDNFRLDKEQAYVTVHQDSTDNPDNGIIELMAYVTNTVNPVTWSASANGCVTLIDENGTESSTITTTTVYDENGNVVTNETNSNGKVRYHKIRIKGIKATTDNTGMAVVTAVQKVGGSTKSASCNITVGNPVTGLIIDDKAITPVIGNTYELTASFTNELQPYNGNLKWISSNSNIAEVEQDSTNPRKVQVTFKAGGTVTITVVSEDGMYEAHVTYEVTQALTGIKIDQKTGDQALELDYRLGSFQLSATITPDGDGVNKGKTWKSLNPSVAKVNENGLVEFIAPGTAAIVVQADGVNENGEVVTDQIQLDITNPVTNITLDYTELTLRIGFGQRLSATVEPANATDTTVKWTSSDQSVATVDENGYVTAVNAGSCNILCVANDGNYTAICTVTVIQPVLSVSLSESTMTVVKGTYFWLSATVSPDNANNKQVNWVSSNSEICTVGSDGQCVAVAAGKCTISAVSLDSGVAGYCEVTVTEPVTGILLNTYSENMIAGNKLMLLPTVLPVEATNKNVTYVSSDPSVATVDVNGIVTAVAGGSCSIKVTTEERQLTAVCNITVKEYVSSITLDRTQAYLNYGASMQLTATVAKETATDKGVTWSSNNPGIISVDQAGVVRAVNYGTAVISVVANDGGGAVGTCTITVIKPVTEIGLDRRKVTIIVGETVYVTPTVYPSDATIQGVTWSSSDSNIATVDFDGQVTGMAVGKCEVTATSTDGNNVRSSCIVTVVPAISASGVKINSDDLVMLRGKTRTLKARLTPGNSTEGINWVSSDTSVVVVDGNGTISTVGPGVAEVTAYSSVTGTEDSCKISVIQMNSTAISLEQYDTYNLFVDYAPDKTISWRTSNNRVATISQSGLVTARKPGTCTIYATIEGKTVSCTVTVVALKR